MTAEIIDINSGLLIVINILFIAIKSIFNLRSPSSLNPLVNNSTVFSIKVSLIRKLRARVTLLINNISIGGNARFLKKTQDTREQEDYVTEDRKNDAHILW